MNHIETEEFLDFLEHHFNIKEMESYRLLVREFMGAVNRKGPFEGFIYKEDKKKYHLYFFYGKKNFYTLAGHLERQGEPVKGLTETVKNYIEHLERED